MAKRARPSHSAEEFGLDVIDNEADLFKWFLLCLLYGKPIRSDTAIDTWKLFLENGLDNPVAIVSSSQRELVRLLNRGGYTRYQHVTARSLQTCMKQLIDGYEGSLYLMIENSFDEDEFMKRLKELYGVGPKVAEIFARETEEFFARRVE